MAVSIRDAYGQALVQYGGPEEAVVVLDADVASSTRSGMFGAAFPERFFNVGIAEANMVAMAAGFAATGKIPFVNTFSVFLSTYGLIAARAFGSYSQLNIKLMGAYGGLSDSFDGPTHHSVEDLAIFRSLPNFRVYVASDAAMTRWLVRQAIKEYGPMYIRLSRESVPDIYSPENNFAADKGKVLQAGQDLTIIACGTMVNSALQAAKELAGRGINAEVIDMFCLKPIDSELILETARRTGAIISIEEHSVIGGLGSAIAEVLADADSPALLRRIGIRDTHAECGPYSELLDKYKLNSAEIIRVAEEIVKIKGG